MGANLGQAKAAVEQPAGVSGGRPGSPRNCVGASVTGQYHHGI